MHSTFRSKLMLIVGTTILACVVAITGGLFLGARQARDLSDVEGRLVPRFELGPQLEADFDHLRRGLQDASAAQDARALEDTAKLEEQLLNRLASAGPAMSSEDAGRVRHAVEDYYSIAHDVTRRLIRGETGEALLDAVANMQAKQAAALDVLHRATRLNHGELADGFATIRAGSKSARRFYLVIGLGAFGLVAGLSLWLSRGMIRVLGDLSLGFERFGRGDFARPIPVTSRDELGDVARLANQMAEGLVRHAAERDRRDWIKASQLGLADVLRGELDPDEASERTLRFLTKRVDALAGAIYLRGDDGILRLRADSGLERDAERPSPSFRMGEGLVGRAANLGEVLIVQDAPQDYLRVRSGLGESAASSIVLLPFAYQGRAIGVAEFAFFSPCTETSLEFLSSVGEVIAITLEASRSRAALKEALEETRQIAERLAAQEEELRHNNDELQVQQEELRGANEELEENRRALAQQNAELDEARRREQQKADEVAKVSAYKSQFLANMSHELRTPLNSMLLLSHLMSKNESQNLTPGQVEYCKTVHSAGKDLLGLINQLLDLAKIEAGRQEVYVDTVVLADFAEHVRQLFGPLAADKQLSLIVEVAPGLPEAIATDRQRVERILTNLIGNAIKFTEKGEVALSIRRPDADVSFGRKDLTAESTIAFVVSDTGIGIAADAHEKVFAPFEQIESRTDRRYGGTGLGLAIARESATLLGGELRLQSTPGQGSTFTLYLPQGRPSRDRTNRMEAAAPPTPRGQPSVADDRASLAPSHGHLLVIEDDRVMVEQFMEIIHARKLHALVATTGEEGLRLAREHRPQGIILDVKLPDLDGFAVMERLKVDPATSDIPVHFVSAVDTPERGLALGAIGYLTKPVTPDDLLSVVRTLAPPATEGSDRILVVEDDSTAGESLVKFLRAENLEAEHVTSAGAALAALESERFGCMILDLGLPDMDGLGMLEALRARPQQQTPPVVVYTGRALTRDETRRIEAYAQAVVLKDGRSELRLLEELRLFVRHVKDRLPKEKVQPQEQAVAEISLIGKTILVADDDMRTVYALSALLHGKGADVLVADTGREALDVLAKHRGVDAVLMDVMMPEMDGYEAMRALRRESEFETLPVIALTAKAMKGERERCIEAGASDYLAKPVDGERLLAVLSSWLKHEARHADG